MSMSASEKTPRVSAPCVSYYLSCTEPPLSEVDVLWGVDVWKIVSFV